MNQVMVSKLNLKVGGEKNPKNPSNKYFTLGPISSLNNPLINIEANFLVKIWSWDVEDCHNYGKGMVWIVLLII